MDDVGAAITRYAARHLPGRLTAHTCARVPFVAFSRKVDMQR